MVFDLRPYAAADHRAAAEEILDVLWGHSKVMRSGYALYGDLPLRQGLLGTALVAMADHSAVVRAASVIAADDPRDVRDLFVGALEGLGVWIPSEREARCRVVSRHAARLVEDLDNIEQVATSVTAIVHLDDVMYREIGDPWLGFARLCWSWFDDDLYMANGGEDELRRWAEQCALRPAGSA